MLSVTFLLMRTKFIWPSLHVTANSYIESTLTHPSERKKKKKKKNYILRSYLCYRFRIVEFY